MKFEEGGNVSETRTETELYDKEGGETLREGVESPEFTYGNFFESD